MSADDEAFKHDSVLLHESIAAMLSKPSGIYVDATFGRGGHSREILKQLGPDARLIAIDKDPEAIAVGERLAQEDSRFQICHGSFAQLGEFLDQNGIERVDGVLADLGVSSPQLDDAERGFSFQNDGPLDMRMDITRGLSAAQWLAQVSVDELANVLKNYGEERFAKRIANAIVEASKASPLTRTLELAKVVSEANPAWEKHKHPATRAFQAIRIFINRELEDLELFLEVAAERLALDGRLAIISFHSLEDRAVKRFMRDKAQGVQPPPGVPVMEKDIARHFKLSSKAIKAGRDELERNVRARSAVLRSLQRLSDA